MKRQTLLTRFQNIYIGDLKQFNNESIDNVVKDVKSVLVQLLRLYSVFLLPI